MSKRTWVIAFLIIIAIWASVGWFTPKWLFPGDASQQPTRGTWGDQFGAVNSLFSALAFAALLGAIYIQNKELAHAIESQRDATIQQTKALEAQMILQVTDEIRSQEWGEAHNHLRKYHKSNPDSMRRDFAKERLTTGTLGHRHEINRRAFIEPCYKVHNLKKANIIGDDAARIVLTPDLVLTLLEVVEPLEGVIRTNYDRSMFDWARSLYSNDELNSRGVYIHDQST